MMMGLNLAIQDTMTAVKPRPPTMVVVMRVVRTGGEQQADEAADRAGEDHGAHDDALDLDARIARGALAFADNGDLIAVLAVIEIDIHNAREDRHKQDRPGDSVWPPRTGSQPASVFWLMMPILPEPLGTSHTMMKNAASWVAM